MSGKTLRGFIVNCIFGFLKVALVQHHQASLPLVFSLHNKFPLIPSMPRSNSPFPTSLPIDIYLVQIMMLPLNLILCLFLFSPVKVEILSFGLFQTHVLLFEPQSRSEILHGSLQCSIIDFIAQSNKFRSNLRRPMPQSYCLPTRLQSSPQCCQRPTPYISYIIPYNQTQTCNI